MLIGEGRVWPSGTADPQPAADVLRQAGIVPLGLEAKDGLALINGSKYTLSDIRYLGLCQVVLGCICIFVPAWGLTFWAIGFGGLHILYGIVMWNKYKYITKQGSGG